MEFVEFDKALEFAVTLAWNELVPGDRLLSARVEYESKPGVPVDSLTVWTLRSWGYQDRVCDYWTTVSQTHPAGLRFSNSYHSDTLAEALDYIMKNQARFPRLHDAWRPHLVLIQPPAADKVAQAAAWMPRASVADRAGAGAPETMKRPHPGPNATASHQRMTRITTEGSPELVDTGSGYPNGPWCR